MLVVIAGVSKKFTSETIPGNFKQVSQKNVANSFPKFAFLNVVKLNSRLGGLLFNASVPTTRPLKVFLTIHQAMNRGYAVNSFLKNLVASTPTKIKKVHKTMNT